MGCRTSQETREQRTERERSEAIDRRLEEDARVVKQETKLLLLGAGESGKSTIVKQMKIIHQNGFTRDELLAWRPTIYKNLVESVQSVITAVPTMGFRWGSDHNQILAHHISQYTLPSGMQEPLPPDVVQAIDSICSDPVVPYVLDRCGPEFYLMDSATYFFSNIRRIGQPDYIPTEADVLRARLKSTGITETRFSIGPLHIHMFDVGGQRSERRKWIHCFENVTSIIFCVALSEYDQVLLEEAGQNRMLESLILFESIVNSRWFLRASILLFLNKIDVFKVKLRRVPLEWYFVDYTGGPDVNKAAKYILWRFNQVNRAKLNVYPHLTQATDTSNIR
ncbi:Guanine nucleotide-binding protein subunit alpha [Bifiguratus adelaidae]|uniref:Guanine nucleotide-binding protein subunit alpha n=1 Tax=Bifiguratus adelaidae TaxID=1938954 RepID=A0A261Y3T2_9FUNG|nr:Guanine nucleotide-binding protein subunit alpha [Bifiguratus adelaidae]